MDSINGSFKKGSVQKIKMIELFNLSKNLILNNTRLCSYLTIAFVFLFSFIFLSAGSFSLPLIDRDEPRFAQAAREMLEKKNYLVPFFNGEYRLDKPPLIYWLMIFSYSLLGINEFSARLPSILACSILSVILYRFSSSYSPRFRLFVPLSFICSVQTLIHGRLATADMVMVLFVTLAQWAFLNLLHKKSWSWLFVFWISLALGFLAKGPISWLVPLFTFILFRFVFWRKPSSILSLYFIPGSLFCLGIISLWAIPALIETKGLFWKIGMGEHVIRRGMEAFDNRPFIPFYYFISPFLSLFPASAFFGLFVETLRKKWSMDNAFLLSWFLAPILIFSFYATELPHYIMPGFPAYFLVIGQAISETKPTRFSILFALFLYILFFVFSLLILFFGFAAGPTVDNPLKPVFLSIGLIIFLLSLFSGAMMHYAYKNSSRAISISIMATAYITLNCVFGFLAKDLHSLSLTSRISPLFKNMPFSSQNYAWGYTEPSLVFYSNKIWKWDPLSSQLNPPYFSLRQETETSLSKALLNVFQGKKQPQLAQKTNFSVDNLPPPGKWGEGKIEGLNLGRMSWVKIEYSYQY
ncbi:glycosyltransferase family 39 protein [Methylacidiphilum caldifontis]|nr:glycosyltransferase family 39 protein [Methylacidiphilum caldifontis]